MLLVVVLLLFSCFGYTKHFSWTGLGIMYCSTHSKCMFLGAAEPDEFITIVLVQHQFPCVLTVPMRLHRWCCWFLHGKRSKHHVLIKCRVHNLVGDEVGTHVEYTIYYRGERPLMVVLHVPLHFLSCTALTPSGY